MKFNTETILIAVAGLSLIGIFLVFKQSDGFITGVNSLTPKQRNKVTVDPNYPGWHYWIKYDYFPIEIPNATIVSDTITIVRNLGNEIAPDNKIIYTMDIRSLHGGGAAFKAPVLGSDESGGSMAEIMLTCEADKDYFNTAFQGYSAHIFKMLPMEGHTYKRTFMLNLKSNPRKIVYVLTDLTTGEQESFDATLSADTIVGDRLIATSHAVEYHDKFAKSGKPLPPRYEIKTSISQFR